MASRVFYAQVNAQNKLLPALISYKEAIKMANQEQQKLQVRYLPVEKIKRYEGNPRLHSPKQVAQIRKSIESFGFLNPILLDENCEIIAGHGRLEAALQAGMKEVPTILLEHLTEVQKKAYRLADNKLTELGEWDVEKLQIEFQEIEMLSPEISLDITGFETGELDNIMNGGIKEVDPKENNVPFIPEDEIVTQQGDIWQLGRHRIICGNSLEKATFETLMEGKKAEMVLADAPFNLSADDIGSEGNIKHKDFQFAHGEMTEAEFKNFLKQSFTLLRDFSKEGSLQYLFMDWRHVREMSCAGSEVYTELKNICVWNKSNAGMGSFYRSKHELVFIYKNGKAAHINNIELGAHGRSRSNVWDYAGVNSFGEERKNLKLHPTVKPTELVKDAILDASNRGGIILDSFLGSGTTLIAAEKVARVCYGIEIEQRYVDTAIRRYEEVFKKDAIHVQSGKTYKELLAQKKEDK